MAVSAWSGAVVGGVGTIASNRFGGERGALQSAGGEHRRAALICDTAQRHPSSSPAEPVRAGARPAHDASKPRAAHESATSPCAAHLTDASVMLSTATKRQSSPPANAFISPTATAVGDAGHTARRATPSHAPEPAHATASSALPVLTAAPTAATDSRAAPLPPPGTLTARDLSELFGAHSPYASSTLVPLVADRIGLPAQPGSVPLTRHMHDADRQLYEQPERLRLSAAEIAANGDTRAHRPGRVGGEHGEYVKLCRRAFATGLWGVHDPAVDGPPPVVNGVFTVRKDDAADRLIVDARPANACFVTPLSVSLPTPDVIGELEVGGRGGLFVAKTDLSDYYHQLALPAWLTRYFCLPPVRRCALALAVGADDEGDATAVSRSADANDQTLVYPKCLVLPMGWSHSVIAAQMVHETIVSRAGLFDAAPPLARLASGAIGGAGPIARLQVYIDDVVIFGTDQPAVDALQERYMAAIRATGLTVKASKTVRARRWPPVKCVGVEVDGQRLTAGVSAADLWQTIYETHAVLRAGYADAHRMASLIGSWNWALGVSRCGMAVFQAVYRFVAALRRDELARRSTRRSGGAAVRGGALWPSVRGELRAVCDLAPLLSVSIRDNTSRWCVTTDASSTGYGVAHTELTGATDVEHAVHRTMSAGALRLMAQARAGPVGAMAADGKDGNDSERLRREAIGLLRARGEGRSLFVDVGDGLPCTVRRTAACGRQDGGDRDRDDDDPGAGLPRGFRIMSAPTGSALGALRDVTDRLVGDVSSRQWVCALSGEWRQPSDTRPLTEGTGTGEREHINALELRTAGYGLSHALRLGVGFDSRFVLLTDSTVALGVLTKGRSSSPALLRVMRRISAVLLATGVRPHYRYVESEVNPADAPSRSVVRVGAVFGRSAVARFGDRHVRWSDDTHHCDADHTRADGDCDGPPSAWHFLASA